MKFLNLIRVLFPNWNFFDQIGHSFAIEYRTSNSDFWTVLSFPQKRLWSGVLLNPEVNLALAQVNIIEHFAADVQEHSEEIESLSTFKMLRSLLKVKLPLTDKVQFKVVAKKENEIQILYTSAWVQL